MGPEEVPACKESVEALEMVKLEAGQVLRLMEQCAICHGENMIGFEAKRMHCQWLGAKSLVSTMLLWASLETFLIFCFRFQDQVF